MTTSERPPSAMWDERYSDAFASYGTSPNDFVAARATDIPAGPVLVIAAGEGRDAVFLAERGHAVHAVDLSAVGLANAVALAEERGVRITTEVADLATYDFGEQRWSGIVAIWAHVPPSVRTDMHRRCVASLAPGGVYIGEAYAPAHLGRPGVGGPPDVALLMTPDGMREELAGLEFLWCKEVERDVAEGRYHSGPSTTTQVVARKPLLSA